MLYTILTSRCPFEGSLEEVLGKTVRGEFRAPSELELNWQVPESLNAVVLKAMSVEQSDRYDSVEALRSEVQNFLVGKTTIAENAGLLKEAQLFYKRNLLVCNVVIFALSTILIFGSIFLLKLQQKNVSLAKEKNRAEENFQKAETEKTKYKKVLDGMYMEKNLATAMLKGEYDELYRIFVKVDSEVFQNPVEALREAEEILLKVDKESHAYDWVQMQLNYIYYLRQQYHLYKNISIEGEKAKLILAKVEEMATLKQEDELSSIEKIKELVVLQIGLPYSMGSVLKMIKYDGAVRESKQEHAQLVEVILKKVNQSWQGGFEYDAETRALKLTGRNFYRLSLPLKNFI